MHARLMIKLVAYDPAWSTMFEVEANEIHRVFGDLALQMEHVGSTAVPGLSAKPVIEAVLQKAMRGEFARSGT